VNVHLKKPGRVLIRHFVSHVEQLNSYLKRLPGVIDSPKAITKTKKIEPFDEAYLDQLILKICPIEWQNQYSLSQGIILKDTQSLMVTLEIIKTGENDKKPKAIVSGEKKAGENKGGILKRMENAVSHSGMSAFLRKPAHKSSVTSVRNMEGLMQPIILGIVRSTRKVELLKRGSNLRESPTGMRTLPKS